MSEKTKTIVCVKCGAKTQTTGTGDFTTYVCEVCQDKVNLPAYKREIEDLKAFQKGREDKKEQRLPSFDKRIAFLRVKVAKIKELETPKK